LLESKDNGVKTIAMQLKELLDIAIQDTDDFAMSLNKNVQPKLSYQSDFEDGDSDGDDETFISQDLPPNPLEAKPHHDSNSDSVGSFQNSSDDDSGDEYVLPHNVIKCTLTQKPEAVFAQTAKIIKDGLQSTGKSKGVRPHSEDGLTRNGVQRPDKLNFGETRRRRMTVDGVVVCEELPSTPAQKPDGSPPLRSEKLVDPPKADPTDDFNHKATQTENFGIEHCKVQ
jgi:hypothetical protein